MGAIKQVPKTALDVFRMLPEGTLCEVIDNILYMSPTPKYDHQRHVGQLVIKICNYVDEHNLGEVIISPFDVYFDDLQSAVQPDIIFVSHANRGILKEDGYIHGAPDLIIEVLSGDKKRDRVMKKSLYERAGVKEYFMVNPADRKMECYTLQNGKYGPGYTGVGIFTSALLGISFEF
jgi:Uma2 family endonuclease